jgi:flagellar basal-body rod protein FlgC
MSFDSLDISASALYAQRLKMDAIASNIANVNTTRNPDGTPGVYKRKDVVFQSVYNDSLGAGNGSGTTDKQGMVDSVNTLKTGISFNDQSVATGVKVGQIIEDSGPLKRVYNPSHPDADKDGYLSMPNVNIVTEMVEMMAANKAYEANLSAMDTTKNLFASALRI